jgi:cytochrome c-type biogenesis protein CcmE
MVVDAPAPVPAAPRVRPRASLASKRRVYVATAVIVGAMGWLLWQGLGNATVFFKTADEAVAQRASLGTRRFRIEGTVVAGTVHRTGTDVSFTIANNGVSVPIVSAHSPPELFQDGIPVVLEGHFAASGPVYLSDLIIVKHTASYRAAHPDRVKDYPPTPTTLP